MSYLNSLMTSTGLTHLARPAPSAQSLESRPESPGIDDEVVAPRQAEVPPAAPPGAQAIAAPPPGAQAIAAPLPVQARQPRPDKIDVPSVLITPRPPLAGREPQPRAAPGIETQAEAVIQPAAVPTGVSFLEAAAERVEREQTNVSLLKATAAPASSKPTPAMAQTAPPPVHIEAPPAQAEATFALVREWVAAPAQRRQAAPSVETDSVVETARQNPKTAYASPSPQPAESDATRFEAAPSEHHVSLNIGAIELTVEAPSTPPPAHAQRPARQRSPAPSGIEVRRAARRWYGRTGD
jgi:hypothetical protein